ncbi:MAG: sulfatase-like hydrolase/transferase [Bacteroidetes bacterium]|nr:sulfatase-like hydrolase/transferase [Bacteroidota bacterium]
MRQTLLLIHLLLASLIFAQQKPNIIYIYADDLGYGELGCYGQEKIKTPNLDKMAAEGMKFTQHYASAPVCAPSRCMLLTGKHSGHSYIRGNYELGGFPDEKEGGQMPLPEGIPTLPKMLQKADYATACIGKWGLGMANTTGNPNAQGFDYFYGYLCQKQAHNYYPTHLWENGHWDTLANPPLLVHQKFAEGENDPAAFLKFIRKDFAPDKLGEKAIDFIQDNKAKPFFLYLPLTIPHVSLQVPQSALAQYPESWDSVAYLGQRSYCPVLRPRATYAAMITYMDSIVGQIMLTVKQLGLEGNTLVMFSSDNGATFDVGGVDTEFFNSTGGLRGRKMDLWEGGIRIPFIAWWPGKVPAGKTSDLPSVQFDLMATLADLLHLESPPNDGISMLPTMLGSHVAQAKHPFLYFEFPERSGQVAIRMGNWKGVKSNMKKDKNAAWEVFDLENDPAETTDLAAQQPDLVQEFETILQREHRNSHVKDWEFVNPKFD